MEKRIERADGTVIKIHVVDEEVAHDDDRPPIEGDPDDDLGEGATGEAIVLVEKTPSTMTIEGAIAGFGQTLRSMTGHNGPPPPERGWWHDWGKYVVTIVAFLVFVNVINHL